MRRGMLVLCMLMATALSAQNISVASFKLLDSDLTAYTAGTMERDQNGEVAALIKVVTTEQGFVFDGGMTGIVKIKQEVGELWVYVPHGIKKVTIKHPQLGVLRDYYFPIPIEKARTYEMVLTTGRVETIVNRTANKQYVTFTVNPSNAMVELDGIPLDVDSDGYAEKAMPYGTYSYRVSCANYHTEAGQVAVTAQGKAEVAVTLRPNFGRGKNGGADELHTNFGWIEFGGADELHGAHIYVDNERIGQLPMKSGELKSGVHQIKVLKPLYKPWEQQVTVTEGNTTQVVVKLVANFANVTFATDADNEIWIDDKLRGKGQCTIGLEIGEYTVEVKREAHHTVSEVINVVGGDDRTFQLPSPIPMYGILNLSSAPSRATVYIDGVEVGHTPLMKSDVLVGSRKITFEKEGYETMEQFVEIQDNAENKLSVTLKEPPVPYEAVDLGLSVKWANCNVGAKSPEEYGDYFAWGETKTKSSYTKKNSITRGLSNSKLKSRGIIGSDGNLTAAYDAATANLGGGWRMPTLDEMKELCKNCSWSLTTQNDVKGYKITGPNGNSIFLPAAGFRYSTSLYYAGSNGLCWSATPYSDSGSAYSLGFFYSGHYDSCTHLSDRGMPVRPVSE